MAFESGDSGGAGGNPVNIDQQIQNANAQLGNNSPYIYAYDSNSMNVAQVPNPNYNPGSGGGLYTGTQGAGGGMTQYESAQVADAKAKLAEQQREFDSKQAQDLLIFNQQQHTEEEKLDFARQQENNKVQFQYAQLAQTQQQFEQNLGWDKTKFYTQFGLDVTKEQDQAVQQYRDALMKEQGSPQDMVSYLYNIRGYTAPAGGTSQAMPLSPSVLAAYQAQGIPIPGQQSQSGGPTGQQVGYPMLGNMPYGFGGGAGNMAPPPIPGGNAQMGQQIGQKAPPMPIQGQPLSGDMMNSLAQFGQNAASQYAPGQPTTINPQSFVPPGQSYPIPGTISVNSPFSQGQFNVSPGAIQYNPLGISGGAIQFPTTSNSPYQVSGTPTYMPQGMGSSSQQPAQSGSGSNSSGDFNVWQYLPPQLQPFFTPSSSIGNTNASNLPGTNSQPSAIIPSAQMYGQLNPSEQGALQSFQSQQLGIMPDDMKSMMNQNAPIATGTLAPDTFQ